MRISENENGEECENIIDLDDPDDWTIITKRISRAAMNSTSNSYARSMLFKNRVFLSFVIIYETAHAQKFLNKIAGNAMSTRICDVDRSISIVTGG